MATRFEDLTSFVDGVADTFQTSLPYKLGSLVLGYNGSVFPPMVNIKSQALPKTFQLEFVPPADSTALMIIYEDAFSDDEEEDIVASSLPPRGI